MRQAAASQELLRRLGAAEVVETISGDFDLIIDGVGGATFGLAIEHVAARGSVVNIATPSDAGTVTFHAALFERAKGARIYTLDILDDLTFHGGGAGDLARLCTLVAEGRLDGQSSSKARGASLPERWTPSWNGASAARPCSTSTDRPQTLANIAHCSAIIAGTTREPTSGEARVERAQWPGGISNRMSYLP